MSATRMMLVLLLFVVFCVVVNSVEAGKIEAVQGKRYALTKQHGPWMIMVATFQEPPEELKTEGKTPDMAADELVYELRKTGIPAYSFARDASTGQVETQDRMGRGTKVKYKLEREICVIAGNYENLDSEVAQNTLAYIKKLKPQCLTEGGVYRETPGQPGPLAGAFLTVNPLLSPEEIQARKRDPEILQFNAGMEHSLLTNKGEYSLVVASFKGKSVTKQNESDLDKAIGSLTGQAIDVAYWDAWKLTQVLRKEGYEAYVFHDRYQSYVTVGTYSSDKDPAALRMFQEFGAKIDKHPQTGQPYIRGNWRQIPDKDGNPKLVLFDPEPRMMRVPKHLK